MNQGTGQERLLPPKVVDVHTLEGAVLASIPTATMVTDREGCIVWVNQMFEHLTGYASDEVIGRNPRLLKSDRHDDDFYQDLWKTVLSGETWHGEVINRRKDGALYHEEMAISSVYGEQGEVVRFVAVKQDITKRKLAEQELLSHASAIELANSALEQAHEEAETARHNAEESKRELEAIQRKLVDANMNLAHADKMASIGRLAAGVAHEINNPIGFITSNLNSLSRYVVAIKSVLAAHDELLCEYRSAIEVTTAKADEVDRIRKEADIDYVMSDLVDLIAESTDGAKRVRQIVADLKDFSHVDSADVGEVDVNELLDKTINVASNELKYKTEVVREYGEPPTIIAFGGKLGQVFLNLLVNAAQAIAERGTITVRTGQDDGQVWVEVEDTGCGMPPEVAGRVFEPFFTTKEVGEGTGMGLHLAYNIVDSHDGSIECKSTVGKGTIFHIELPIAGPSETKTQEASVRREASE